MRVVFPPPLEGLRRASGAENPEKWGKLQNSPPRSEPQKWGKIGPKNYKNRMFGASFPFLGPIFPILGVGPVRIGFRNFSLHFSGISALQALRAL